MHALILCSRRAWRLCCCSFCSANSLGCAVLPTRRRRHNSELFCASGASSWSGHSVMPQYSTLGWNLQPSTLPQGLKRIPAVLAYKRDCSVNGTSGRVCHVESCSSRQCLSTTRQAWHEVDDKKSISDHESPPFCLFHPLSPPQTHTLARTTSVLLLWLLLPLLLLLLQPQ